MNSNTQKIGAKVQFGDGPVSLDEMHDLTDVFMNAIHQSFSGRVIDGRALAASLVASALGVLRDIQVDDPKAFVKDFASETDLEEIQPFTPHQSA